MRKFCLFITCCITFFVNAGNDYNYYVDLTKVENDKIQVKLTPPDMAENDATFMFPSIVPGTYAIYNFGRFISDLKVVDKNGAEMPFTQTDKNTYKIANGKNI